MRFRSAVVLVFCVFLCGAVGWAQSTSQNDQSAGQPTPELSAPRTPPTLEDMPSQPPTVTYQHGKLTIIAKNSTLKDILQAVCEQTGAQMDIPEGAKERVVLQLGPGSPRDVMASLLNGSHFNYVMLGSVEDPSALVTVVLTSKSDEKETGAPGATAAGIQVPQPGHPPSMASITPTTDHRAWLQRTVVQQQQQLAQSAAAAAGEPTDPPSPPEETPQASAPASADAAAPAETPAQQPPGENRDAAAKDNAPKTPMQTLQDLYSARYQMMQQQNQPRPQPQQQEAPPPEQQQSQ